MNPELNQAIDEIWDICEASDGRSRLFEYGSSGYKDGMRHFLESSSDVAEVAVCPGTTEDVSKIMKVLANYNVPFGIKGGGHNTNPKFSSTTGIQLYMSFMDKIEYDKKQRTLAVGAGCLWDRVYRAILAHGRYVVGGSATEGVGVAGWLLGGGYSLYSNQYGLGIDNVIEYEIVTPNGDIIRTGDTGPHSDLFWALKGGGNNFGIITEFVIRTYRVPGPYARLLNYSNSKSEQVKKAIADFINDEETQKAALIAAFRYYNEIGKDQSLITVLCVQNGPPGAEDPFREFEKIEGKEQSKPRNIRQTRKARTKVVAEEEAEKAGGVTALMSEEDMINEWAFFETDALFDSIHGPPPIMEEEAEEVHNMPAGMSGMMRTKPIDIFPGVSPIPKGGMSGVGEIARGRFGCIMISKYKKSMIDAIDVQAKKSARDMKKHGGKRVIFDVWPAHSKIFDTSSPAAFPHKKGNPFGPMLAYFVWEDAKNDQYWVTEMHKALRSLHQIALTEGCTSDKLPFYSNTSLHTTKVREIYRENYEKLRQIRLKYDPQDVMRNAGGFRIRLPRIRETSAALTVETSSMMVANNPGVAPIELITTGATVEGDLDSDDAEGITT